MLFIFKNSKIKLPSKMKKEDKNFSQSFPDQRPPYQTYGSTIIFVDHVTRRSNNICWVHSNRFKYS